MCKNMDVAPDYMRGFDRRKGFCAKVFMLMTVAYFAALIPVSGKFDAIRVSYPLYL